MKLHLSLPVIMLTLAVVACGKKDSSAVVDTTAVVAPVVQPFPYPSPYPGTPTGGAYDLASFCQTNGGQLSGAVCRFERSYQNNSWFSQQWGSLNTGIAVYAGERAFVNVSGSPRIYVGGVEYASGSASFVSNTSGYLSFQRFSATYSVQQVRIQSCFSTPNVRTTCP